MVGRSAGAGLCHVIVQGTDATAVATGQLRHFFFTKEYPKVKYAAQDVPLLLGNAEGSIYTTMVWTAAWYCV